MDSLGSLGSIRGQESLIGGLAEGKDSAESGLLGALDSRMSHLQGEDSLISSLPGEESVISSLHGADDGGGESTGSGVPGQSNTGSDLIREGSLPSQKSATPKPRKKGYRATQHQKQVCVIVDSCMIHVRLRVISLTSSCAHVSLCCLCLSLFFLVFG